MTHKAYCLKVYSKILEINTEDNLIFVSPRVASLEIIGKIQDLFNKDVCEFEVIGWIDNIHIETISVE